MLLGHQERWATLANADLVSDGDRLHLGEGRREGRLIVMNETALPFLEGWVLRRNRCPEVSRNCRGGVLWIWTIR